jgi:hypothetical protein
MPECAAPGFRGRRTCLWITGYGSACAGIRPAMTEETYDRVGQRAADLLPEEQVTGSDDPQAQAEAILADSDAREADLEAAPDSFLEHRTSGQTLMPGEGTR